MPVILKALILAYSCSQYLTWLYDHKSTLDLDYFFIFFFWQISSKVSNTAPDLIDNQKPQSSHSSSRVGVTLVAGVATVALGAFVFHRVWSNSWQRKENLNRWHGVHAWQRFTTSYLAERPIIVKCVTATGLVKAWSSKMASAYEPSRTLKNRCEGSCFSCNDTVTLGKELCNIYVCSPPCPQYSRSQGLPS